MFDVKIGSQSLKVTGNLDEAIMLAKQQNEDAQVYDFRTNNLICEWSPVSGLRKFLSE
jgi:hypothetical protein